jgi:hypothetical protein
MPWGAASSNPSSIFPVAVSEKQGLCNLCNRVFEAAIGLFLDPVSHPRFRWIRLPGKNHEQIDGSMFPVARKRGPTSANR